MWLTLDIGNSGIKAALFDGAELEDVFRINLFEGFAESGIQEALADNLHQPVSIERVGVSSVVPRLTRTISAAVREVIGVPVEILSHQAALPFRLDYVTPETLGLDRIAAAAAAWELYSGVGRGAPQPVIAIDAGTAVTYDVVDANAVFRGGVIAPGPVLMVQALHSGTAQLPEVEPLLPHSVIGRTTTHAMQSGIMFSFIDSVRAMIRHLTEAIQDRPRVVVTGGWSTLLQAHVDGIHEWEPNLVLHGVRTLMALNPPGR